MNYRFVTLTSSGQAANGEDWSCASDMEAIERAAHTPAAYGAELWRGEHRLGVFAGPMSRPSAAGSPEGRA